MINDAVRMHDFRTRTLLNSINGFADVLADANRSIEPAAQREYAEIIRACTAKLQTESQDFILELARSNVPFQPRPDA